MPIPSEFSVRLSDASDLFGLVFCPALLAVYLCCNGVARTSWKQWMVLGIGKS